MSLITDEIRASATELYHGNDICKEKSMFLLTEVGLPNGLLPLQDIEECGYVKETGFVWLRQKKKTEHKFQQIGKLVSYAPEVTAYVEPNRIKKLTGVKTKELFVWITLNEIYVDDPPTGKITFATPAGLSRSFPVSAFEIKEEVKEKETKEEVKEKETKEDVKEEKDNGKEGNEDVKEEKEKQLQLKEVAVKENNVKEAMMNGAPVAVEVNGTPPVEVKEV